MRCGIVANHTRCTPPTTRRCRIFIRHKHVKCYVVTGRLSPLVYVVGKRYDVQDYNNEEEEQRRRRHKDARTRIYICNRRGRGN